MDDGGVPKSREQQVIITLRYHEDDKQLSQHDIVFALSRLIEVLNCRRDVVIAERRDKEGKTGLHVKAYRG